MKTIVIRLRRTGRWKKPVYTVVVTFKNFASDSGMSFERLGFYPPATNPKFFFMDFSRTAKWLMRGATVTKTVGKLMGQLGSLKR